MSHRRTLSVNFFDRLRSDSVEAESPNEEVVLLPSHGGGDGGDAVVPTGDFQLKPRMFRNRFLNFVRFGSVINGAAESFFKSEIRRRLFVTAVLIVISRVGYFIPLPGFDRRLIPQDYMSFVSGSSVGELNLMPVFGFQWELNGVCFETAANPKGSLVFLLGYFYEFIIHENRHLCSFWQMNLVTSLLSSSYLFSSLESVLR